MEQTKKICCLCKKEKQLDEFYKCSSYPDKHQYRCKTCQKMVANTDKKRSYARQYGKTKKGLLVNRLAARKYHNSKRSQEIHNAWRERNKEKISRQRKIHYLENQDRIKAYHKIYYIGNKEKAKIHRRKRKALKRGVYHEPYTDAQIFNRDNWICGICGQKINKRLKWPNPRSKSIDHIIPMIKGGSDSPINLQASHLRCNLSKHAGNGGQLRLIG